MEEARKKEHLSEITQRQELAEQQILKLEAELAEEQKKKEELVSRADFTNLHVEVYGLLLHKLCKWFMHRPLFHSDIEEERRD